MRRSISRDTGASQMGFTDLELDALCEVLTGLGSGRDRTPAVLNRHDVLHGNRPHIGTEKDSLQCVLVLHALHWLLSIHEVEDRQEV